MKKMKIITINKKATITTIREKFTDSKLSR